MKKLKKIIFLHFLILVSSFLIIFIQLINLEEQPISENERTLSFLDNPKSSAGNWAPNGTAICINSTIEYNKPKIAPDGSGGAFITWEDESAPYKDIYIQRLDSNGNALWGPNGTVICNRTGEQSYPVISSDSAGNAYVAWVDGVVGDRNISAQKINSTGHIKWGANGTVVCNASNAQWRVEICSDENGGLVLTWVDERDVDQDIYAQLIDSNGNPKWGPNGTVICNRTGNQNSPTIINDGNENTTIVWQVYTGSDWDIWAQRVDKDGIPKWGNNGTAICNATDQQWYPEFCLDGLGGAIITWEDRRADRDVWAQRVDKDGNPKWGNNGTGICNLTSWQEIPRICSDGNNGAIISWHDNRIEDYDIYAQRIDKDGTVLWGDNGTIACSAIELQTSNVITSDDNGGAIIAFKDDRGSNYDIYVQHILSNGNLEWNIDGTYISQAPGNQEYFDICGNGNGGAFITWRDLRQTADIYATVVIDAATVNQPGNISTYNNGTETIDWIISGTPTSTTGRYRVFANDTYGNKYLWQDWTSWLTDNEVEAPINRSRPGRFYFLVEFQDSEYYYGGFDEVIITILDRAPVISTPPDLITNISVWDMIQWIIYDDYSEGQFRILANDTNDNSYVWMGWNSWKNNTAINVPINRVALGIFEYTIEFNTTLDEAGSDSVLVTITNATSGNGGNGGGGGDDLPPDDNGTPEILTIHDILLYIFAFSAIGLGVASILLLLKLRSTTVKLNGSIEKLGGESAIKKKDRKLKKEKKDTSKSIPKEKIDQDKVEEITKKSKKEETQKTQKETKK